MQLHFSGVVQLVRCCDGIRDLFRDGRLLLDSCLVFDELNDNGSELFQNLNDDQVAILRRVVLMFNLLFNLGDNLSDLGGETCRGPFSPSRFHVLIPAYHGCRNGNVLFIGAYGLDNQPLELVQDGLNKRIL